jgi:hypothetical protein
MANAVYPKALEGFLKADIDMEGDIRAQLIDLTDYTYSSAHEFLSSVPAGARVGSGTALSGKTYTNGVFGADPTTVTSVPVDTVEAVIVYLHTGADGSSRLISYHDTDPTPAALSLTTDGGNVIITWPTTGSKIFSI